MMVTQKMVRQASVTHARKLRDARKSGDERLYAEAEVLLRHYHVTRWQYLISRAVAEMDELTAAERLSLATPLIIGSEAA